MVALQGEVSALTELKNIFLFLLFLLANFFKDMIREDDEDDCGACD